jgi:hypothetical protein
MAFFRDAEGDHYVAVRWYETPPIAPVNTVLELPGLHLARDDESKSYSVLPEKCIINGSVLIKCEGTYWAVQSPREEVAYARNQLI